tara:strand:+ start:3182 stop:4129 length:948 start_codon:yes stop_codon:yes gene_type:complete
MTGPWMADTSEEKEHPTVPIGLNEMTIPRIALVMSVVTLSALLVMSTIIGWGVYDFLNDFEESLESGDPAVLQVDGRWGWESHLLFDTCSPLAESWIMPENLSAQDDMFLYPGELSCDWSHQGQNDHAVVVIYNHAPNNIDLLLSIDSTSIVFSESGESTLLVPGLDSNSTFFAPLNLLEDVDDETVLINASHVTVMDAVVSLEMNVIRGADQKPVHSDEGDSMQVHYRVWDADNDTLLDEGDLPVTAGDDDTYIDGFGWSALGLDIGQDRGLLTPGTSHFTLLPPPIAYGGSEGHFLEHSWLRFELELSTLSAI